MIKKALTLIMIYIFYIGTTYAFLGEGNGLNLYSNIEKGMKDLQLKNFKYEISGGGKSIGGEINRVLKIKKLPECIKDGLTEADYKLIVGGSTKALIDNLKTSKGCFYKDKIDNKTLNDLMSTIVIMDLVYRQKANNKSDDIYKISRIGIYSDGDLNNSAFDLMSDIENIDKIIFTEEIPYNGEEKGNINNNFADFLNGGLKLSTTNLSKRKTTLNPVINNTNKKPDKKNKALLLSRQPANNSLACLIQNNSDSGFNTKTLLSLLPNNKSLTGTLNGKNPNKILSGSINTNSGKLILNRKKKRNKLNILSNTLNSWPCQTFFCIKIDYQTYYQNILAGGNAFSIESYMNITNGYLRKFSGTSLVQSRMTVNQFQLGLKNLHLADIFHMGIMIIMRAPPIIVDDRRKPGEYKRRLKKYYRNNDKNYDRRNSLVIYKGEENERRTITDSAELPIITVKERDRYLKNRQALESKQNKLVENEFDKKILYEDMDIFYKKFIPLESFTKNVLNYSENASTLIRGINDKPSN